MSIDLQDIRTGKGRIIAICLGTQASKGGETSLTIKQMNHMCEMGSYIKEKNK